jgi:peptidoglycan hydrolase-like protein with peptidoglycan-binding domain
LQQHPDADRYIEIQKALVTRGYLKSEPNGQWGEESVDALKRFQTDQNLTVDGKISALALIGLGLGPKHDGASVTPPIIPVSSVAPASPSDIPDSVPTPKFVTAQSGDQSATATPKKPQ